jgi:hypothetical protein
LEGRTNISECIFEALFKGASTGFVTILQVFTKHNKHACDACEQSDAFFVTIYIYCKDGFTKHNQHARTEETMQRAPMQHTTRHVRVRSGSTQSAEIQHAQVQHAANGASYEGL